MGLILILLVAADFLAADFLVKALFLIIFLPLNYDSTSSASDALTLPRPPAGGARCFAAHCARASH